MENHMPHQLATGDDKPAKGAAAGNGSLQDQLSFKSRFVLVFGEIDDQLARRTCERLIALAQESDAPIQMLISSPGGHVESGDAIHDVMRFVRAPVTTIGTGWVASAGTHIYLSVPKERRLALPNTRFMIHQPAGGAGGQASDIAIQAKEIIRARERIAGTIARETGQPLERVRVDIERDFWMSTDEAIAYGLVSRVVERQVDLG
jgi:ATP-dependent Clp protease protease subunit